MNQAWLNHAPNTHTEQTRTGKTILKHRTFPPPFQAPLLHLLKRIPGTGMMANLGSLRQSQLCSSLQSLRILVFVVAEVLDQTSLI